MQIRNDVSSYQNHSYGQSHTHYLTESLHEEEVKKPEGNMGGSTGGAGTLQRQQQRQDSIELSTMIQTENKTVRDKKTGFSSVKGFWDSLGDEANDNSEGMVTRERESFLSNLQGVMHHVSLAVRNAFGQKIFQRIVGIPAAVKTGISTALKKFGKGKEAFMALSDERMPSGQQSAHPEDEKNRQVATRKKEKEMQALQRSDNHLMDSYSKTGAYCKLNENLTYQKPKSP